MTSWKIQNEMIDMFSHSILRRICAEIKKAGPFSIIVDGTQDVTGYEQESICIRYVDGKQLQPVEVFMGLYSMDSTTGEALARRLKIGLYCCVSSSACPICVSKLTMVPQIWQVRTEVAKP